MAPHPRSLAARRHKRALAQQRRSRPKLKRPADPDSARRQPRPERHRVVTVRAKVANAGDRKQIRDAVKEALANHCSRFESDASASDDGVDVTITVIADDDAQARTKALYWIERAVTLDGRLRWTGFSVLDVEVKDGG